MMPKETEKYLLNYGLKNALYTIKAEDYTDGLFGNLVPCPYQVRSDTMVCIYFLRDLYLNFMTCICLSLFINNDFEWYGS